MLIQIIVNTPIWVFILFFALLITGYIQSKDRTLSKFKLITLPMIMIVLSLSGVYSTTGVDTIGLFPWSVGIVLTALLTGKILPENIATYTDETKTFSIPGSWYPMALIMAIFLKKYSMGILTGMNNPIVFTSEFIIGFSFLNGCFSGIFLARVVAIIQKSRV